MSDLDNFWDALDRELLGQVHGWEFARQGDLVYFSLSARDSERYRLRIACDGYRSNPPDPVFVDADGVKTTKSAWPNGDNYFHQYIKPPPNCFICMPLSRTGLQKHNEWKSPGIDAWNAEKHSLMDLCNFFYRLLNSSHYTGRLA